MASYDILLQELNQKTATLALLQDQQQLQGQLSAIQTQINAFIGTGNPQCWGDFSSSMSYLINGSEPMCVTDIMKSSNPIRRLNGQKLPPTALGFPAGTNYPNCGPNVSKAKFICTGYNGDPTSGQLVVVGPNSKILNDMLKTRENYQALTVNVASQMSALQARIAVIQGLLAKDPTYQQQQVSAQTVLQVNKNKAIEYVIIGAIILVIIFVIYKKSK